MTGWLASTVVGGVSAPACRTCSPSHCTANAPDDCTAERDSTSVVAKTTCDSPAEPAAATVPARLMAMQNSARLLTARPTLAGNARPDTRCHRSELRTRRRRCAIACRALSPDRCHSARPSTPATPRSTRRSRCRQAHLPLRRLVARRCRAVPKLRSCAAHCRSHPNRRRALKPRGLMRSPLQGNSVQLRAAMRVTSRTSPADTASQTAARGKRDRAALSASGAHQPAAAGKPAAGQDRKTAFIELQTSAEVAGVGLDAHA